MNSGELRLILQRCGYKFESETNLEAMAVLTKFIYDSQPLVVTLVSGSVICLSHDIDSLQCHPSLVLQPVECWLPLQGPPVPS